jgi:hypothetical protein
MRDPFRVERDLLVDQRERTLEILYSRLHTVAMHAQEIPPGAPIH